MSTDKLDILQTQKKKCMSMIKEYEQNLTIMNKTLKMHRTAFHKISKEIKDLTNKTKEINISEHAVVRYLERVGQLDINEVKSLILSDSTKKAIKAIGGNCEYPVDNFRLVIRDNTVVTVKT